MTVIHIILMAPYIQTKNEEIYLYNYDVTYYVITCNSAFECNNDVTYYVITPNYQWTPEILTNYLLEAGCTNKLCPFQYKLLSPDPDPDHHREAASHGHSTSRVQNQINRNNSFRVRIDIHTYIDKHTQTGPRVTRDLLRLVWQFDGIVQKHKHKRLLLTLKCSFDYPEHKIINSHSQF